VFFYHGAMQCQGFLGGCHGVMWLQMCSICLTPLLYRCHNIPVGYQGVAKLF